MAVLDRERLTNYPRIFVALYVLIGGWWLFTGPGLLDRAGTPVGGDFVTFHAASELLREQGPAALFDLSALHAVEERVIGAELEAFAWHYPPPAMLAVWPLALLPFLGALGLWSAASLGVFIATLRSIDPDPAVLWLGLAFPGLFQNLMHGQNGCFSLGLLSAALMLGRRPWLAGALLGCLVYKPHLLPLAAVALLAGREGRALAGMALSVVTLCVASLVFGVEAWSAFFDNVPFAWRALAEGGLDLAKVPTTAGAALLLGAPPALAQGLQGAVSLVAVAGVAWAFHRRLPLRVGALATGALLATPFAFEYDLVILALPLLLIGRQREPRDAPLLVVAWLAPLALPGLAHLLPLQLTPVLLLAVLWRCLQAHRG